MFHEISSDNLHIDVYHGRSSGDVRYQWLFTAGMSRKPMTVPREYDAEPFAETVICLPPNWPLGSQAFRDENNYWPLRLLKMLARYPHQNNAWLYGGHSLPYGKPFAPNTRMSSVVLVRPRLLGAEPVLQVRDKRVLVWAACPLYDEELAYKNANGFAALANQFINHGVTELLNPFRASVVNK